MHRRRGGLLAEDHRGIKRGVAESLRESGEGGLFPARMHLRLSDQELATLVEMVSLAANIASWNQKENANDQVAAFETLESKIHEKAGHAGMGDWI